MSDNAPKEKRVRLKRGDQDYIENAHLTAILSDYADAFQEEMERVWEINPDLKRKDVKSKVFSDNKIPMPDKLAEYIMLIAERLCTKHQFSRYTFRDEMVSDAILTMIKGAPNFRAKFGEENDTPPNGFAYLSMVAFSAIVNRIKIEARETETIDELILNLGLDYLDDPLVGETVKKLQIDIAERQHTKEENKKNSTATFKIRHRDNFKDTKNGKKGKK